MTYPDNIYDYDAWLAASPPSQLGPAIRDVVQTVVALTAEQRTTLAARYAAAEDANPDRFGEAEMAVDDALFDHPIGQGGCGEITDVGPWVDAIRHRIGSGFALVVQAVACRDHSLISDDDFALLTGWWADAGLPIPAPISADQLAELTRWWDEQ